MSDWDKIKRSSEYDYAKREVERMIAEARAPLEMEIRNLKSTIKTLETRIQNLEAQAQKP